jgi:hypothetical protein
MSDDLSSDPHGYFDLLKAAEQLSKDDESSHKLAKRLLKVRVISPSILMPSLADVRQQQKATYLPCVFRALCHLVLAGRRRPPAVWHAGMAVCVLQMEILTRVLDSADVSAVVERLKFARDKLAEVWESEREGAEETCGAMETDDENDEDIAGVQFEVKDHNTDPAVLAQKFQTMSTQFAQLARDMATLKDDLEEFNSPMDD